MAAKARQIFIWNGKEHLGPFKREELVEQLKSGAVRPVDYYYEQGMTDWERVTSLSCCHRFLATDAQKQMLDRMGVGYDEFLTKADVSSILQNQPATERQLDFLRSFDVTLPASLTKAQASGMIERCLADPAAVERQKERRAAELETSRRDREAFPSYYLKQDAAASERELSRLGREHEERGKKLAQYRRELQGLQQRFQKADGEIERTALKQQIASTRELIDLTETRTNDQPTEIKEANEELEWRRSLRVKFWKATFSQAGLDRDDFEDLVDYFDVIDQLHVGYGRYFKVPTLKQITGVLQALDNGLPDWDKQEPQLFYQKYKDGFPDAVRSLGTKRATSKQGCLVFALVLGSTVLTMLIRIIWKMSG